MILQIVTALAIGAYVVLSRDAQPKRPDAAARSPGGAMPNGRGPSKRPPPFFVSAYLMIARATRAELRL